MKTKNQGYLIITTALVIMLFGSSCSKKEMNINDLPAASGIQLTVDSKFGNVMTDNNGRSLYVFSMDVAGTSSCVDGCAAIWKPFYVENPVMGSEFNPADFSSITRADGSSQTTFKGWPLYYYASETQTNTVGGDAIDSVWFVAKADYSIMVGKGQLLGQNGIQYTSHSIPGQEMSTYMTDINGHTLYSFTPDRFNKNNFTKADFSNDAVWPIFSVSSVLSIPSILDKTQFGIISVFGRNQLTYKGHPLYYFGNDQMVRGSTKGISVPTPGVWPITNAGTPAAPQP